MFKKLIRSAILGGIVVFLWGVVSWMILPWHQASIKQFQNESTVAQVILENAPEEGVYVLPNMFTFDRGEASEMAQQKVEEGRERMTRGPVMFAAISPLGVDPNMVGSLFISVIISIVGAGLIAWVVTQIKTGFWGRVGYVTLLGFLVGFLGLLPSWNWWHFPFGYIAVGIMDLLIAWFLAGLIIAKIEEVKLGPRIVKRTTTLDRMKTVAKKRKRRA